MSDIIAPPKPGTPASREALDALRHSCAHVLAQAVQELFPGTKITIGPPIDDGFYYDFDSPHRFNEDDLARIEARMLEVAKGNHAFSGRVVSKDESRDYWLKRGETYKVEILDELTGTVTHYTHDTFTDLCRGGHLQDTSSIRHMKLLSVAGAYWRGDEKRPMLQRIYGTAFFAKDDLKAHLTRLEEARKRDHRKLGEELDLFSTHQTVGAGLIHWHPKGTALRRSMEEHLRGLLEKGGYQFVMTPHVASEELYKTSGHLQNYSDLMYGPMDIEGNPFRAKPMNCPNHIMIFQSRLHSYKELPIRYAEYGTVYRFERSGVLHGLMRVRGFTQDDAHIFCRLSQIEEEIGVLLKLCGEIYSSFGFADIKCYLSTKPEKSTGESELWDQATVLLGQALSASNLPFEKDEGGGAFYGPKIDIKVKDAIGREWQMATIQLDFVLPRRFGVKYRDEKGGEDFVVMIHRAILGSFERFIGVLIEHYGGKFPLWLAPVQVKVLTLTDAQDAKASELAGALRAAGLRVVLDQRVEKLGHKIREATLEKVPYMAVLGPKDVEAGVVSVRLRDGRQVNGLRPEELVAKLTEEARTKSLVPTLA
ncbi:MAG: threonine--tRNA ligase [Elusimicrobia bacterium]|nr:threonine--tRNA ligase [Elusimicrobiota bacterium]